MTTIFVPRRRRFDVVKSYTNLTAAPRIISNGNQTRGLFIFIITDNNSATNPDRWEVMISGGFEYTGEDAKYFILSGGQVNITSVTAVSSGFTYDVVDDFGRTFRISLNGQRGFNPTIEKTAGPPMVGPVEVRSVIFR